MNDTTMHLEIIRAEMALEAAAPLDHVTQGALDDLLEVLCDAGNASPSERVALLDEALSSLVFRTWDPATVAHISDALTHTAAAHVLASVLAI